MFAPSFPLGKFTQSIRLTTSLCSGNVALPNWLKFGSSVKHRERYSRDHPIVFKVGLDCRGSDD